MCSFTKISSLRGLYVWFHFYFILLNLCVFKLKPGELLMHVRVFLTSQMSLPCYHDALGLLWDISVVYHSPPLHQKLLSQTASCNKEAKNQFLCREKHSLVWVWGLFGFFFRWAKGQWKPVWSQFIWKIESSFFALFFFSCLNFYL